MSAGLVNVQTHCRNCFDGLTLEEMHYLDNGDGTATCSKCEREWMEAIEKWRSTSGDSQMPKRP